MSQKIKRFYVVHHSHTDIGYTDLQERIIDGQVNYIRTVIHMLKEKENEGFRWNCETYFCVEQFLKRASGKERNDFFHFVREGKIGISATYLNFTDLMDTSVYEKRLKEMVSLMTEENIPVKTAMFADINGISMGQRDAMLDHGVEFLFTNIHTHHGMFPLYKNQVPFRWENSQGQRLLVWNGEHYNLGNFLGIKPNRTSDHMIPNDLSSLEDLSKPVGILHENITKYLQQCMDNNYPYDFIISGVSGVFSDNAPPNPEILRVIQAYNTAHGDELCLQMVSLQELYDLIKDDIADAPVYQGDMTDWWANGVGSTPYGVKHYKEARRMYHLAGRLDQKAYEKHPALARQAEDNLLLYAEHTWGHSSAISDPYDTMVLNLDMRKNSYASKAHEASALMINRIAEEQGDLLRYYSTKGRIRIKNPGSFQGRLPVSFYIESPMMKNVKITIDSQSPESGSQNLTLREIPSQLSPHPRGVLISLTDEFGPYEEKEYQYEEIPEETAVMNTGTAYMGAERVQDVINDYDPIPCTLPYEYQNAWFHLEYEPGTGITHFRNKQTGEDMLPVDGIPFFTPVYECTKVPFATPYSRGRTRQLLGRNIRGRNAAATPGKLTAVNCLERGRVFTSLEFLYEMPGTIHTSVIIKLYEELPKIDFTLKLGKTFSEDVESIYLPLDLNLPERQLCMKKGKEAFRPGIDQIPGTCMEYYMSDDGIIYTSDKGSVLIETPDVPLFAMGEMKHHAVKLCDNHPDNNNRPIYSWVMNNTWETNFKLDLSGYCEYRYSLRLTEEQDKNQCFRELEEQIYGTHVLIIE